MAQVLISNELRTLKVGEKLLIPKEHYDEIMKDIELEYQIELTNAICLAEQADIEYLSDKFIDDWIRVEEARDEQEQAENDAQLARNIEISNAIYDEQQAQIDAWDAYIDNLHKYDEYVDITPVKKEQVDKELASLSITEKEVLIEEVEEITLGPVKTLIFGRAIGTKGINVSEKQWRSFLTNSVSERFPDGYTVNNGEGHWKGGDEESNSLVFACKDTPKNKKKLTQIVTEYCRKFNQDGVLKINSNGIGILLQIKQGEDNA